MNDYLVFKFGGASVKDADAVKNVCSIIERHKNEKILVVVSAMGKTTNALEEVVEYFFKDKTVALERLKEVLANHNEIIEGLFENNAQESIEVIHQQYKRVENFVRTSTSDSYDLVYDQIVSLGELISTRIVSFYLEKTGIDAIWLNAADMIRTDNTYREGRVDWKITEQMIKEKVPELLSNGKIVVTQGFMGSTDSGFYTTLGREGSDYTAAIFSFCLDAEHMTIWKDVPGILSGDPKLFENVTMIDYLSYREAIEMTYYGAKVIHPKTIKPLQNKSIPLHVRSFIEPENKGTVISDETNPVFPPIVVVEKDQVLLHISTRDFSFVAEHHLAELFNVFAQFRFKVNLMRNTAISFSACVTRKRTLVDLIAYLEAEYNLLIEEDLELITIRHYNKEMIDEMKRGKVVLLEERITRTIQMVVKNTPLMKRKS